MNEDGTKKPKRRDVVVYVAGVEFPSELWAVWSSHRRRTRAAAATEARRMAHKFDGAAEPVVRREKEEQR
jgi:hypothetical protein